MPATTSYHLYFSPPVVGDIRTIPHLIRCSSHSCQRSVEPAIQNPYQSVAYNLVPISAVLLPPAGYYCEYEIYGQCGLGRNILAVFGSGAGYNRIGIVDMHRRDHQIN